MCIIFFENDKFSSSANPIYMYIYKQHERSLLAMKCAVIFVSKKSYQVQYFVVIVCAIFILYSCLERNHVKSQTLLIMTLSN